MDTPNNKPTTVRLEIAGFPVALKTYLTECATRSGNPVSSELRSIISNAKLAYEKTHKVNFNFMLNGSYTGPTTRMCIRSTPVELSNFLNRLSNRSGLDVSDIVRLIVNEHMQSALNKTTAADSFNLP